jgi:hypothetical protein
MKLDLVREDTNQNHEARPLVREDTNQNHEPRRYELVAKPSHKKIISAQPPLLFSPRRNLRGETKPRLQKSSLRNLLYSFLCGETFVAK